MVARRTAWSEQREVFDVPAVERFFGVVVRPGNAALIAPSLDRESVNSASGGLDRVLYSAGVSNGLPELFERLNGAKRIGVEEDHLNYARARGLAGGAESGRPRGPTSVNEVRAASTASIARIGTSAAISAGTRGQ